MLSGFTNLATTTGVKSNFQPVEGTANGSLSRPYDVWFNEGKKGVTAMLSPLYLSYNGIADELANQEVHAISHKSIISNKRKDITGALIFTGTHFCQFLEGTDGAVSSLADKIRRDPRHTDIWVVHQEAVTVRRFAGWSMGYKGRSNFVGRYLFNIVNASEETERRKAALSVVAMMEEFVRK